LHVSVGHLIYAEGDSVAKDVQVRNADVVIRQHAINLAVPVSALLAQVAELAGYVAASRTLTG